MGVVLSAGGALRWYRDGSRRAAGSGDADPYDG